MQYESMVDAHLPPSTVVASQTESSGKYGCIRALTFVQFFIGSLLLIVGIGVSASLSLLFIPVLVDGTVTVICAAVGAVGIFNPNIALLRTRVSISVLQLVYDAIVACYYIWGMVEVSVGFAAFFVMQIAEIVIVLFVILLCTNHYNGIDCCKSCEVEESSDPPHQTHPPQQATSNRQFKNNVEPILPAYTPYQTDTAVGDRHIQHIQQPPVMTQPPSSSFLSDPPPAYDKIPF